MSLFGDRIKALRGDEKQEAVAKAIGTTAQSLGRYEKGKHNPDIEIALKLADYYNTTVDYLLGRTNAKSIDTNIQSICNYTGLSEEAISILHSISTSKNRKINTVINDLITSDYLIELARDLYLLQAVSEKIMKDNYPTKEAFENDERKYIKLARYEISEEYTALLDRYDYRKQNPKEYQEAINRKNE